MVLNGKTLLEYPVSACVPQGSTLGPTLLLLYTNDLSDEVICNTSIYAQGFPYWGGGRWERWGTLWFFNPTHHDWYPQWEAPKTIPSWKVKPPAMKWSKKINPKKSETVTNTCDCFTHKPTLEKDDRYSTKTWFSHLKHS